MHGERRIASAHRTHNHPGRRRKLAGSRVLAGVFWVGNVPAFIESQTTARCAHRNRNNHETLAMLHSQDSSRPLGGVRPRNIVHGVST